MLTFRSKITLFNGWVFTSKIQALLVSGRWSTDAGDRCFGVFGPLEGGPQLGILPQIRFMFGNFLLKQFRFQIFIGEFCADTSMIVPLPPLWLGFLHELYRLLDGGFWKLFVVNFYRKHFVFGGRWLPIHGLVGLETVDGRNLTPATWDF